jgi:hypothetical protein
MTEEAHTPKDCCCKALDDLAVVPMGGDGLDERVFASLEEIKNHGGDQWWLYASVCQVCEQYWMVAQDERIYDNFYLRRLLPAIAQEIVDQQRWPDEFITYERVLRLGRTMSRPWTFADPHSPALVWTAEDLRRERPSISIEEIAYLLAIPVSQAIGLVDQRRSPT